jgi:hypothetical protein
VLYFSLYDDDFSNVLTCLNIEYLSGKRDRRVISSSARERIRYVVILLILLLRLAVTGANIPSAPDHYRQRLIKGPSPDPELNQSLVVAASQYPNSAKPSLISETQAIGRRPKEQVKRPALPPGTKLRRSRRPVATRKVTATNQSIFSLPDQSACTYAGRHHAVV